MKFREDLIHVVLGSRRILARAGGQDLSTTSPEQRRPAEVIDHQQRIERRGRLIAADLGVVLELLRSGLDIAITLNRRLLTHVVYDDQRIKRGNRTVLVDVFIGEGRAD